MSFIAKQLGFAYGLHEASFEFPQNGLITIAGPERGGEVDAGGYSRRAAIALSWIVHVRRA